MRSRPAAGVLTLLLLASAGSGSTLAAVHERNGFTLELGIGPGVFQVLRPGKDPRAEVCPVFTLGLGGFLNDSMALLFHMHIDARIDGFSIEALSTAQLSFQMWFSDWIFLTGGAGPAFYSIGDALEEAITGNSGEDKMGFGLGLRSGLSFGNWENHSLRATLEVQWAIFDGLNALAQTLVLEWQWF